MDVRFWITLLIIVGPFVINAIRKVRAAQVAPPPRKPVSEPHTANTPQPGHAPKSFEELLKEIEEANRPAPRKERQIEFKPVYEVASKPKPVVLEDTQYDYKQHDTIYETYENAKKEAFSRPSLEETLMFQQQPVKFGAFRSYQRERPISLSAEFAAELRQPSGFKKAFLMSEILGRRF